MYVAASSRSELAVRVIHNRHTVLTLDPWDPRHEPLDLVLIVARRLTRRQAGARVHIALRSPPSFPAHLAHQILAGHLDIRDPRGPHAARHARPRVLRARRILVAAATAFGPAPRVLQGTDPRAAAHAGGRVRRERRRGRRRGARQAVRHVIAHGVHAAGRPGPGSEGLARRLRAADGLRRGPGPKGWTGFRAGSGRGGRRRARRRSTGRGREERHGVPVRRRTQRVGVLGLRVAPVGFHVVGHAAR